MNQKDIALSEFAHAVRNGRVDEAQQLIAAEAWILDQRNYCSPSIPRHKTWLHLAADYGQAEMVELLLRHGVPVDAVDDAGFTPLLQALAVRAPESVMLLLQAGANPNHVTRGVCHDVWAIHYAAQEDCFNEELQALIRYGALLEVESEEVTTPLFHAAQQGAIKNVRTLLAAGAKAHHERNGVKSLHLLTSPAECAAREVIQVWMDAELAHQAILNAADSEQRCNVRSL